MEPTDRLILALDVPNQQEAREVLTKVGPENIGMVKVGLQLFTAEGPSIVTLIQNIGYKVFLDLKFNDIPNTVKGAAMSATTLGVRMFNVHCLAGSTALKKAVEGRDSAMEGRPGVESPLILGVTVLTSLGYEDLVEMGICDEINIVDLTEKFQVEKDGMERIAIRHLAWLASECGLDGAIASPKEITAIREYLGQDFLIVTPGVRPEWAEANDQRRVMTPAEAIKAGANYLVIGRPITDAQDPADAAKRIADEIASGMKKDS